MCMSGYLLLAHCLRFVQSQSLMLKWPDPLQFLAYQLLLSEA